MCASNEAKRSAFLDPNEAPQLIETAKTLQAGKKDKLQAELLNDFLLSSEEVAPVNAIVGGILGNEVLKCISKKGLPIDNLFCYSMLDGSGVIEKLGP